MKPIALWLGLFSAPLAHAYDCPPTVEKCSTGVLVNSAIVNGCPVRECKDPATGKTLDPNAPPPAAPAPEAGSHRY